MDISAYTSIFSAISADWIIFGGCALFFVFDSLRAGPARVMALSIALPISLLLSESVREAAFLGNFIQTAAPAVQTGAFIALTVALFVPLYRMLDTGSDSSPPVQAVITGIACAVILMLVLVQLPGITLPWTLGPVFLAVFSEPYRLYWFLGAFIALAISRR